MSAYKPSVQVVVFLFIYFFTMTELRITTGETIEILHFNLIEKLNMQNENTHYSQSTDTHLFIYLFGIICG